MKNDKMKIWLAVCSFGFACLFSSCMKDFLDVKRNKSQVTPVTLEDYQSVLENQTMNFTFPVLGEIGSDDYYVETAQWSGLSNPVQRNGYRWADDVFEGMESDDWNYAYEKILYANFVLEGVAHIREEPMNKTQRDEIIGAAHFFRGTCFFLLAQLFCKQYDPVSAEMDLGLPLRTTSNINVEYHRATLAATYEQIVGDLETASRLLPSVMSLNTRPYRAAALAMLANVHLQIGDYRTAFNYADSAITLAPQILNYNEIDTSLSMPFPLYAQGNEEVIFASMLSNAAILSDSRLIVDSALYDSYEEHDIRRNAFFFMNDGARTFKGYYSGDRTFHFTGLTTPELYLIRSECGARLGDTQTAVADLNVLLSNRYVQGHFEPIEVNITAENLLDIVLEERRKELIYRGRRWHDLKRFLNDPSREKALTRSLDGVEYTLEVGDPKWVWPIPPNVVNLGGLEQNER